MTLDPVSLILILTLTLANQFNFRNVTAFLILLNKYKNYRRK